MSSPEAARYVDLWQSFAKLSACENVPLPKTVLLPRTAFLLLVEGFHLPWDGGDTAIIHFAIGAIEFRLTP